MREDLYNKFCSGEGIAGRLQKPMNLKQIVLEGAMAAPPFAKEGTPIEDEEENMDQTRDLILTKMTTIQELLMNYNGLMVMAASR